MIIIALGPQNASVETILSDSISSYFRHLSLLFTVRLHLDLQLRRQEEVIIFKMLEADTESSL